LIQSKISSFAAPRKGDCKIMQKIIQAGYKKQDLQIINRCRMWLRAIFLSNIYNGFRNKIQTNCWEGSEPVNSAHKWLQMEKPTQAEWTLWQRALTAALHLNKHHETPTKLGDWIEHTEPAVGWYLEMSTPRLYKWDGQRWSFYIQIPRQTRGVQFGNDPQAVDMEPEWQQWHRAMVYMSQQKFEITGHAAHIPAQKCDWNPGKRNYQAHHMHNSGKSQ